MPQSKTTPSHEGDSDEDGRTGSQLATRPRPRPRATDDSLSATLQRLSERLARGALITVERVQEAVDDAVHNSRITRPHAEDLLARLAVGAREQTQELRHELEHLLSRAGSELSSASRRAREAAPPAPQRVRREVDRARRAVGRPPSFPISDYDELNAKQIIARVRELDKPALGRVRTHESSHANRKSVLAAIDRALK